MTQLEPTASVSFRGREPRHRGGGRRGASGPTVASPTLFGAGRCRRRARWRTGVLGDGRGAVVPGSAPPKNPELAGGGVEGAVVDGADVGVCALLGGACSAL